MTARTERALALALALEREERVELAGHLLASLEEHREKPQGWDSVWTAEAERRSRDGPEHWVEGTQALRELFRRED